MLVVLLIASQLIEFSLKDCDSTPDTPDNVFGSITNFSYAPETANINAKRPTISTISNISDLVDISAIY